jgi:hypothetical protein
MNIKKSLMGYRSDIKMLGKRKIVFILAASENKNFTKFIAFLSIDRSIFRKKIVGKKSM